MVQNGRKLASIFFQHGSAIEYVKAGSIFRSASRGQLTETAEVKSVYTDSSGIPHVRFDVMLEKPHVPVYRDGPRILSLRAFFDNFSTRVAR